MKFIILFASSLFAVNAFAVSVKNCPEQLRFIYGEVEVTRSLEYVLEEALLGQYEEDDPFVLAIKAAYAHAEPQGFVTRTFNLVRAKNGRCSYYTKGHSNERIVLLSSKGKDRLMLQTLIGPRGILGRVYATIDSLSVDEVTLSASDAGFALAIPRDPYDSYSAGGPLVFIGKVKDLELSVK